MKNSIYIMLFASMLLFSCSAVQKTESEKVYENKSVYVFDDVSVSDASETSVDNNIEKKEEPAVVPAKKVEMYLVQVGAFSALEKAKTFVSKVIDKTSYELNIHLRESDNLYVVQLPPFRTYDDAQKIKDELKLIPELEGTFVVVPNSK